MKDLTGQRFGRLTVIELSDKRSGRNVVWRCKCDCGNEVYVRSANLVTEDTKSCGCLQKEKSVKDLTGQRFGRLIAIEPTDKRSGSRILWRCKCDCGNEAYVSSANLVSGNTKSCGCLLEDYLKSCQPYKIRNLKGQRFGDLTVLSYTDKRSSNGNVIWVCRCELCGRIVERAEEYLVSNIKLKNCGCITYSDLTVGQNTEI